MKTIEVRSSTRFELVNITADVNAALAEIGGAVALCHLFVPHTTAAVVVNEAADPDVVRDLTTAYQAMVPRIRFAHAEGNSDSHLLATLLGCSVSIPVTRQRLELGAWQGVFFVELDGPRRRKIKISVV